MGLPFLPARRRLGFGLVVCAGILIAQVESQAERPGPTRIPKRSRTDAKKMSAAAKQRAQLIRSFARQWRGVRYKWGGNTRRGIDCSGYSREMYRAVFGRELPRTTRTQIKIGVNVPISKQGLGIGFEPGDLFFYVDPDGIPNHVVVYMGEGRFTHSASGRGVVIEGFRALWGRRIVGRRMLFPARGHPGEYLAIPAAPPFVATPVPCPPNIKAPTTEIRRLLRTDFSLSQIKELKAREICEWRALASALRKRGGKHGRANAKIVDEKIAWDERIDTLLQDNF